MNAGIVEKAVWMAIPRPQAWTVFSPIDCKQTYVFWKLNHYGSGVAPPGREDQGAEAGILEARIAPGGVNPPFAP